MESSERAEERAGDEAVGATTERPKKAVPPVTVKNRREKSNELEITCGKYLQRSLHGVC